MMVTELGLSIIALAFLISRCLAYYEAQFAQVAPLEPSRDVCVNMLPPYVGRKPLRNRYHLKLELDAQWISFKRISISAYSAPDRYQAFSGMMVQVTLNNLPIGEFEPDNRIEITDCPPGKKHLQIQNRNTTYTAAGVQAQGSSFLSSSVLTQNLACLRSSKKLLQAAVNWVAPPEFDVYSKELNCIVTIIGLNQKYWTVSFTVKPAPYKYPEYGNFTSELKHKDQSQEQQV